MNAVTALPIADPALTPAAILSTAGAAAEQLPGEPDTEENAAADDNRRIGAVGKRKAVLPAHLNDFLLTRITSSHGGSCIFVKSDIDYCNIKCIELLAEEKIFEVSAVELSALKLIIICIYRSPDGNLNDFCHQLEAALNTIKNFNKTVIICGDFNIDFQEISKDQQSLMTLLETYNIKATIDSPRIVTPTTSSTIDQILINTYVNHNLCAGNLNTGFSDHYAQFIALHTPSETTEKEELVKEARKFTNKQINLFVQRLSEETWYEVYTCENTNKKFEKFMEIFMSYFEAAFPLKKQKCQPNFKKNKWITIGIRISCVEKRRLHDIAKTQNMPHEFHLYLKNYKRILKNVVRKAKTMANDKYIENSKNKSKAIWEVIKNQTTSETKQYKNVNLCYEGQMISFPTEIAGTFNIYFANVSEQLVSGLEEHNKISPPTCNSVRNVSTSLFLSPTNSEEILSAIKTLKTGYSCGIDGIPDAIIKKCCLALAEPLSHLCNSSLASGTFPSCLKNNCSKKEIQNVFQIIF
ncbi:uncharacterized protein LOC126095559 [Schistocerca cancellata]|uniref:uncharacterized protein LOC126095559 n=1 Tax=Schistocerca cancellata TaxID=274614 RepID=UPI002118833E|nr:uncharacterized protein LOC126095559 [Schistocerca cancellata]